MIFRILRVFCLLGFTLAVSFQAFGQEHYSQELTIAINDSIKLSGILSNAAESNDRNCLIVMVSPPKRYDRDMLANDLKYFCYLADKFVQKGYSVFRFDNRGIGKSTGSNNGVTLYTHARDVKGVCDFFLNNHRFAEMEIGLLGISEGGSSAIVAASETTRISSLILLSTPAKFGWDAFNYQLKKHFEGQGTLFRIPKFTDSMYKEEVKFTRPLFSLMEAFKSSDVLEMNVKEYVTQHLLSKDPKAMEKPNFNEDLNRIAFQWIDPHQVSMKTFDARPLLARINCPVLALCGTVDRLVQCHVQLTAIKDAVETQGKQKATIVALKNVDHKYQTWTDSLFMQRAYQSEKFSEEAIHHILAWLDSLSE